MGVNVNRRHSGLNHYFTRGDIWIEILYYYLFFNAQDSFRNKECRFGQPGAEVNLLCCLPRCGNSALFVVFCVCMCCVYMWVKCASACVYVVCVFVYVYIICHCFLFPSLNSFFQTCSIAIIVLWNRMCKSLVLFYYHKDLEMLIFSTKCTLREENKILYARSHYSLFKRKKRKMLFLSTSIC